MKLYDELVARGLIAQVTNEAEIREMARPRFTLALTPRRILSMWGILWPCV